LSQAFLKSPPSTFYFSLPQRAFAARWAISLRSSDVNFAARALPPFMPPSLPSATAAGFLGLRGNCMVFAFGFKGAPIAVSTTLSAFCAVSPLLERVRMVSIMPQVVKPRSILSRMEMDDERLSTILVGVAGEYLVAGELSRRGLIAAITLRNSKGIDILVSRPGGQASASIQVKTSLNPTVSWQLNKSDETPKGPNHYYVFVVLNGRGGHPEYHVVKGDLVTRCKAEHQNWLKGTKRDGSERKDTDRRVFKLRPDEDFKNRWDDIQV